MSYKITSVVVLIGYVVVFSAVSFFLLLSLFEPLAGLSHGFQPSISNASSQFAWSACLLEPVVGLATLLAIITYYKKYYKLTVVTLLLPLANFIMMATAIFQEPALLNFELSRDPVEVYFSQGRDYAHAGDHRQAIASFTQAIELAPNSSYISGLRGDSYYELGEYEKALVDYNQAIEVQPTVKIYVKRGVIYDILGKPEQATLDFKKAIELYSDPGTGYNNVAWLLAYDLDTHYEQALEYALYSVELSPNSNNHDTLALVYYKLKQYEKAVEHYTIALSLGAESESYKRRGDAYLALGDKQAALADYKTYLAKERHWTAQEEVRDIIKSLQEN